MATLNMSGGVINATSFIVGQDNSGAGTGLMNLTGGTINANYVAFGNNYQWSYDHASGTGTIGAGAVLNSNTWVDVGNEGQASNGAVSQLTINGTLNVNTANAGGGLSAADGENVQGTITINPGATVRIENNGQIALGNNTTYAGPTGVINQNGGSVIFYSDSGTTVGGTGYLNMPGANTGGSFTYNLNGGTLQVPRIGGPNGWGSTTFNFNGGLLKATGNQSSFLMGNAYNVSVQIQSGGAIIDDSGYTIGIPTNLSDGGGGGGLTKLGSGVLILSGYNSYTGGTTIGGGTLNINADAALGAAPGSPAANVTFTHNGTLQFGANNVSLNANRTIALNGNTVTLDTNGNAQETIAGSIIDGTGPGSIVIAGIGTMTFSGSSSYTGTTTVNIGTLNLASGTLGATTVNIGPNGTLTASGAASIGGNVTTTGAGAAINLQGGGSGVLSIAGNLNLAASSVLGFQLGSTAGASDLIDVAGSVSSAAGHEVVNLATPSLVSGSYTLLTAAAGGLTAGGTDFTLGSLPNARGSFALNNSTTGALVLSVTANPTPAAAYWSGAIGGNFNWNGGSGSQTNWATDSSGGTDTGQIPGPITNVYFTANNAVPSSGSTLATALDLNYSIDSLTFAVSGASSGITSVVVNPNGHSLTMGTGGVTLDVSSTASATIGAGSIILAGSQSWANNNSSMSLTVSAAVAPMANIGPTTLTFNGTDVGGIALNGSFRDATFSPLSLVFNQAGVTQLNGSNTFTGGVTISSGTLQLGNTGALNAASPNAVAFGMGSYGVGDLRLNGNSVTVSALNANDPSVTATVENGAATPATLTVNNTGSNNYNGVLQDGTSASLTLTKAGTGTLYLTGVSNTYTGGTNLNGGILNFVTGALSFSTSTPNINFHGGTLQWASFYSQDVSAGIAPIAAGQAAILDTNGNNVSFASSLTGSGGLTKTGGGVLTLLNSNSYSGVTTVNGGTLQIDNGGSTATPGTGNIVIGSGGNVALDRSDSYLLNNNISGAGTLYQIGSGTATLAGNNSGVGITVASGAVTLAGNNAGLGNLVVTGAGLLTIAGSTSTTQSLNVGTQNGDDAVAKILPGSSFASAGIGVGFASGGTGTINMTGGTVNESTNSMSVGSGVGGVGIMNMSDGVLYVSNASDWLLIGVAYPGGPVSGIFNMNGGLVHVRGGGNVTIGSYGSTMGQNSGMLSVSGGTMQSDNTIFVGYGDGAGTMTVSGAGLVIANSGVVLGDYGYGPTDSSGIVNLQGGVLRTSGVALYGGIGAFNFSGGTLENAAGANLNVTMPVNLSGPGTVLLQSSATGAFTSAAPISGDGSLLLAGGGTLTLSGTNTYTGATTVLGGELIVASPNGIDALDIGTNNLSVGSPSELALFGTVQPADHAATAATAAFAPVPEPGTLALLAAGAVTTAVLRRRKQRGLHRDN